MALTTILGTDNLSDGPATLNGNFDYLLALLTPLGVTTPITLGASPAVYTAGSGFEYAYLSGGSIQNVTRNGVAITTALPMTVILPPGTSIVITYDSVPTLVVDK